MRSILGVICLVLAVLAMGLSAVAASNLRSLSSPNTVMKNVTPDDYPVLNLYGGDLLWPSEESVQTGVMKPAKMARSIQTRIYTIGLASLFLIAMGLLLLLAGSKGQVDEQFD